MTYKQEPQEGKKVTQEEIDECMEQLRTTSWDPNLTLVTGGFSFTYEMVDGKPVVVLPTQDALITPRKEDILEDKQI